MIDRFNTGTAGFKQSPFGNIQRAGSTPNGRVVYRVVDSDGAEAGTLSVPQKDADKFETAYKDIMSTAPKIQKYVAENSSESDIKKRRTISRALVAAGGMIGAIVPVALMRKKASTVKTILASVGGIVVGLSAGFAASLAATTPPGSYKFAKATRTLSKIDVQPVPEEEKQPSALYA